MRISTADWWRVVEQQYVTADEERVMRQVEQWLNYVDTLRKIVREKESCIRYSEIVCVDVIPRIGSLLTKSPDTFIVLSQCKPYSCYVFR